MIRELSHWTTTVHSIHDALKSLGHLQVMGFSLFSIHVDR